MKEYTIVYTVTIDGEIYKHTDIRDAYDERDAIGQIHYSWYPAKVNTISVKEN